MRRPIWFAAVLVSNGLLAIAILAGELTTEPRPDTWKIVLDVVAWLVGSALLLTAWRRPVPGALALVALSAISPTVTPLAGTATLWVAMRRPLTVASSVAAAGVAAQLVLGAWRTDGRPLGWWFLIVVAAYAAVVGWGAWLQARRALIASLEERALRAEAEQTARAEDARRAERTRIAREMHDVLAHRLSLLATYAGALAYNSSASPEEVARAAEVVRSTAHQALDELREVIGVMRDGSDGSRAGRDVQPTMEDLPRLIDESRQVGATVDVDDAVPHEDRDRVPPTIARTAYRVVQEGLTNARKHAPGEPIRVEVQGHPGGSLDVVIANPLPDASKAPTDPHGAGTGLVGLAERVSLAGGTFEHGESNDDYVVRASLPWPA